MTKPEGQQEMTLEQARAEAVRRWGPTGWAHDAFARNIREVGRDSYSLPKVLGRGGTFEAAFADADSRLG